MQDQAGPVVRSVVTVTCNRGIDSSTINMTIPASELNH